MINKNNWEETQEKWRNYWNRQNTGRPLMRVVAEKEEKIPMPAEFIPTDPTDKNTNAEKIVGSYRNFCENHEFLGESFPNLSVDFGPGSVAAYLGSDIIFNEDTVWFTEVLDDLESAAPLVFNPENKWFTQHIELVKKCKELAGDDFFVCIPDLMENIDVLVSLRGAQDMIFEMVDDPEIVEERIGQVSDVYFEYYDRFYEIVKAKDNSSAYTVFQIWGDGRVAKLQCDFSALMAPQDYYDFIQKPLREQAKKLDKVLYHLDGPDAIKHLDAIMEIEEIDALQWTSGDHGPDGLLEDWYIIYDKAYKAGKSLWIKVYSGTFEDWLAGVDKVVARYGSDRMFLTFPEMPMEQAKRLLAYAEENWSDVRAAILDEM
ncbi:MAG: trimethylamine corrinoid protein 2 [Eubacteriales bacterium]